MRMEGRTPWRTTHGRPAQPSRRISSFSFGWFRPMLKIARALGVLVDDLLTSGADARAAETEHRAEG